MKLEVLHTSICFFSFQLLKPFQPFLSYSMFFFCFQFFPFHQSLQILIPLLVHVSSSKSNQNCFLFSLPLKPTQSDLAQWLCSHLSNKHFQPIESPISISLHPYLLWPLLHSPEKPSLSPLTLLTLIDSLPVVPLPLVKPTR